MSSMMLTMVAAVGFEALLLLLLMLTVSYFRNRARKRRDLEAARTLVARVKKSKPEREKAITVFLEQRMGLSGDDLAQAKVAILRAELSLLQRFAGIYRQREATLAARFDDELVAAVAPYHALNGSPASVAVEVTAADPGELEHLRADNQRLANELRITMETMSRMLNEYSTMFAGQNADDAAPIAAAPAQPDADEPAQPDDDSPDLEIAVIDDEPVDESNIEIGMPEAAEYDEADAIVSTADAVAAVADAADDDEIAEIMRAAQAQDQEEQARGAVDEAPVEVAIMDDEVFEEGPSEVLGFDEVAVDGTGIDDLFDSAEPARVDAADEIDDVLQQVAETDGDDSTDEDVASKAGSTG